MKSMLLRPVAAWNASVLLRISPRFQDFVRSTSDEVLDDLTDPYEETIAGMAFTIDWGNENVASIGEIRGNGISLDESVLTINEPYAAFVKRMTPEIWRMFNEGRLRIPHLISFGAESGAPDLRVDTVHHDEKQSHYFLLTLADMRLSEVTP